MHIMMTKQQFKDLKKKASSGSGDVKLKVKEEDDIHGTIEFPDAIVDYFYNELEGRLYIQTIKRITLAAYVAGDNIITEYLIAKLSEIPAPTEKKDADSDSDKDNDANSKKEQPEPVNQ